jgi:hypothetical protein
MKIKIKTKVKAGQGNDVWSPRLMRYFTISHL